MYVCCVKYFAFRLRLLLCLYYDTAYFNWIGERGKSDRITLSSFEIYSVSTNDDECSRSQP